MKRYFITLVFSMIMVFCYGQFTPRPEMRKHFFNHKIDIRQYEVVDSFPLERMYIYSPYDYESDKVIDTGSGTYLIEIPHKDKMVYKTNKDRTKAIVVYNSFVFGRHKEFNIKDTDKRTILWYQDDDLYCGYIYDKKYKVCKYFESNDFISF